MRRYMYKFVAQMGIVLGVSLGLLSAAFSEEGEGTSTQFQDWTVTCSDGGEQRRCAMVQLLRVEGRTEPLLRIELNWTQSGGMSGAVVTPFGLDLSKGMSMSIDGGERWNLPYRTCQNFGCVVRLTVNSDVVERLRKGSKMDVSLYTLDGANALEIPVSLTGFSAASDALFAGLQ